MRKLFIVFMLCLMASPLFAETIKLNSGKVVEGKIVERGSDFIKVDQGIGVNITYYLDEITSINDNKVANNPPQQETENSQKAVLQEPMDAPETNIPNQGISLEQKEDAADNIPEEEKLVFVERLKNLIMLSMQQNKGLPPATQSELDKAAERLMNFSKEFPNSKLADDARFLNTMVPFMGAVVENKSVQANIRIAQMWVLIKRYPDGAIEKFTRQKILELAGANNGRMQAFYIPYKYIIPFMKGILALGEKKYNEVLKEYSILKDNLDFEKYKEADYEAEIYTGLWVANKELGKTEEANNLIREMKRKFPYNENLMKTLDKVIEAEKSRGNVIDVP